MKIQVRRHVFETNSSTNHTLAIRKIDHDKIKRQDKIYKVPSRTFKEVEKFFYNDVVKFHEKDFQLRLDVLFYSALANYSAREALEFVFMVKNILECHGIKIELNIDKIMDSIDSFFDTSIYGFLNTVSTEDLIIDFLFSNEVYYTEYCDECGTLPSKELEAIDDLTYGNDEFMYVNERS